MGAGPGWATTPVSVTVDDAHLAGIEQVAQALREQGMQVEAVLGTLGIVTGNTPDAASLRQVEGVRDVAVGGGVQLPPAGDDLQ